jgi:hypothetical protein
VGRQTSTAETQRKRPSPLFWSSESVLEPAPGGLLRQGYDRTTSAADATDWHALEVGGRGLPPYSSLITSSCANIRREILSSR